MLAIQAEAIQPIHGDEPIGVWNRVLALIVAMGYRLYELYF